MSGIMIHRSLSCALSLNTAFVVDMDDIFCYIVCFLIDFNDMLGLVFRVTVLCAANRCLWLGHARLLSVMTVCCLY